MYGWLMALVEPMHLYYCPMSRRKTPSEVIYQLQVQVIVGRKYLVNATFLTDCKPRG